MEKPTPFGYAQGKPFGCAQSKPFPPFPLEEQIKTFFSETRDRRLEEGTGLTREFYLDLAEPIARAGAAWVDEEGRVIDPYRKEETATTTARFVAAISILIGAGRCLDLIAPAARAMDRASEDLCYAADRDTPAPDFFTRDLVMGYRFLRDRVSAERAARWREWLGAFDPEKTYRSVGKTEHTRNVNVYAVVGEVLKRAEGIADREAFIEGYLEHQRQFFTAYGMYRDPNDPMTYDYTIRQNLCLMLDAGYDGLHRDFYDEMLRRGSLTMLFCQSPTGEAAFGGRSNQFHMMEGMIACACEYEARRYAEMEPPALPGRKEIAGAFKRAGRLAVLSTVRWWKEEPFRHVKNRFHPGSRHGCDGYGDYSVYGLLAASLYGVAYLMADDGADKPRPIAECPTPFEVGGYVVSLPDDFHKVFATCRSVHVEVDTTGHHDFDATGLGRFHRKGVPTELGLSGSITSRPHYDVAIPPFGHSVAIGPGWMDGDGSWHYLADYEDEVASAEVEVIEAREDVVRFKVIYSGDFDGCDSVVETYRLSGEGLEIEDEVVGEVMAIRACVPLLCTDGMVVSEIEWDERGFRVRYEESIYEVSCLEEEVTVELGDRLAPNRNGAYRMGYFEKRGRMIRYGLRLASVE